MARVLLSSTPWQHFHTLRDLFPDVPPLGLQVLAGSLRDHGHDVRIADVQHLPPLHRDFCRQFEEYRPDVVGFSNNEITNTPVVLDVARWVRQHHPHVRIIVGGQIPSFRPDMFLDPNGFRVDAVALYEAERTVGPIVDALQGGGDLSAVPGVAYLGDDGELKRTDPAPVEYDLDKSPIPHWDGSLKRGGFTPGLSAAMETSRGCPFTCSFCSIPGFYGRRARYKTAERILTELRLLRDKGVTEVYFIDDSFGTRPRVIREVFEAMIREQIGIRFLVQIRADIVAKQPDLIELGAKAGMFIAVVGFEGYTDNTQHDAHKGNSRRINIAASRILRKNGVAVYGTHVFGSPGSRFRDDLVTFLAGRHFSDIYRMTIFTPLPGSDLFRALEDEGRIASYDASDYYYGKYLIKDARNPLVVGLSYFGFQALHYALPSTVWKALGHPDPTIRTFNRRAYKGAVRFALGTLNPLRRSANGRKP